jgi:Flp pilus assembly protein TadD
MAAISALLQHDRHDFSGARNWAAIVCMALLAACSSDGKGDRSNTGRQAETPGMGAKIAYDIAQQEYANGNDAAAINFYRRALQAKPDDTKSLIGLGEALLHSNAPKEAADAFRQALERAPHDPAAIGGLGMALVALDQPAEAADLLHKNLPSAPTARGFRALVVAEDLLGQYAAAVMDAKAGLVAAPDDLGLRDNLGLSQALAGKFDEAITTMRVAASSPNAGAQHRLNLALVLGLAGRTAEARKVAAADLDARSVETNLAFYAVLRGLTAKERAEALLRPGARMPAQPVKPG